MYQACLKDATGNYRKFSFLCPPGSGFDPEKEMCDIRFGVDCGGSKNVFSFAIKTMSTENHNSNGDDVEETNDRKFKKNPKRARQLLPKLKR